MGRVEREQLVKSDSGRVAQNWPFSLLEFWQQTREVDSADYELL